MKRIGYLAVAACTIAPAAEVSVIKSYIDTDVCAHLLLGPITTQRMDCSKKAIKEGDEPVVVRLSNGAVFQVNKTKMIKEYVGQLAEVTGELKIKDGEMKLQSARPIEDASIPQGDPARKLLDVRAYKVAGKANLHEKIRHELAMMPYVTVYDFISFTLNGGDVTLTGWTIRPTNRSEAANRLKNIEGVESVVNNIEVLPVGSNDNSIRAGARAALQRNLSRYFWGSGSDIRIIVRNGDIILLGAVVSKADSDLAYIQCNQVPNAFKVVNLLQVNAPAPKEKKG
jgi:hyperosmotically inducible protein